MIAKERLPQMFGLVWAILLIVLVVLFMVPRYFPWLERHSLSGSDDT